MTAARHRAATVLGLILVSAVPGSTAAQLRLPPLIGSGMVLQRNIAVPIWGWADRGDTVAVTFEGRTYTAAPNADGRWTVTLPPRGAGGPYEMTVAGRRQRFQIKDIWVGDVWLCAGQSNMVFQVERARDAAKEISAANDPRIRHFKVPEVATSDTPVTNLTGGAWAPADSQNVRAFTAVGYFFARELRKSVDVPIGLINTSSGGTEIEQWMNPEARRIAPGETPTYMMGTQGPKLLYHSMVYPLLPFPIKGILWYQGESNAIGSYAQKNHGDYKYRAQFAGLIQGWRSAWGLGDIPFLFVQLPEGWSGGTTVDTGAAPGGSWAVLRESQSTALRLPNTGQVVTVDLRRTPDEFDIAHPPNKQDVGARLALVARKVAYRENIEYSGPLYRRLRIQGDRAIVEFDHADSGLVVGPRGEGSELADFAIAGADRRFVEAKTKIERNRIVVWSERVPMPVAVRYAWADKPKHTNLYNRVGLPASPFRTDDWPLE